MQLHSCRIYTGNSLVSNTLHQYEFVMQCSVHGSVLIMLVLLVGRSHSAKGLTPPPPSPAHMGSSFVEVECKPLSFPHSTRMTRNGVCSCLAPGNHCQCCGSYWLHHVLAEGSVCLQTILQLLVLQCNLSPTVLSSYRLQWSGGRHSSRLGFRVPV